MQAYQVHSAGALSRQSSTIVLQADLARHSALQTFDAQGFSSRARILHTQLAISPHSITANSWLCGSRITGCTQVRQAVKVLVTEQIWLQPSREVGKC